MRTSEAIKSLRSDFNMSQKTLAEKLGVSVVTIRCWESGSKSPSAGAIIALSKLFNVSSDYILGISSELPITNDELQFLNKYRSLDKYNQGLINVICDYSIENIPTAHFVKHEPTIRRLIPRYINPAAAGYSGPIDGDDCEMIQLDESAPSNADFAVRIQGCSMLPYIQDGDTVFVKRTSDISIGEIGVFNVDGSMYCKLFSVDSDGNTTLVSTNPDYAESNIVIPADTNISAVCFGRVLNFGNIPMPDYLYSTM